MYQVILSKNAAAFFEDANAKLQQRLDKCFEQLQKTPHQHPNIKALKGNLAGYYRYRSGDYRIIYEVKEEIRIVLIVTIAHRKESYL